MHVDRLLISALGSRRTAQLHEVEGEPVNQIFANFIRNPSKFALAQISSQINTEIRIEYFRQIVDILPVVDKNKELSFWKEYVEVLDGCYMPKGGVVGLDYLND